MNSRLKATFRVGLKVMAAAADPLLGPMPGPRILIYHQVGADFGREMEVSTEAFEAHLDWLGDHAEIVDLETAIARREEPNAAKVVALTFDDGFDDVYRHAFPLLKEREVPFTLYLTTGPIESRIPLDPRYPDARPLTWNHVNRMADSGLVTLGAHTHSHPDLRHASRTRIAEELDRSNDLIHERTGSVPHHFTYPWGWWSESAEPLVRERYKSATVGGGSSVALHRLSRVPVQRTDRPLFFRKKIGGGLQLESMVREMLNRYSAR